MSASNDDFDWVSAQAACTTATMFQRLLEGTRKDVERRQAAAFGRSDEWRFEFHQDDEDHFEVTRAHGGSKAGAYVTFERVGPRINVHGDGVDVGFTAIVGINAAGECRFFIGEGEFLGWEVRKQALDLLFFEDDAEE